MSQTKTITIIGASGFIGHNLINYLLTNTDYSLRAFARNTSPIKLHPKHADRVRLINGDAFNTSDVESALKGSDAVVYLLHMMAEKGDYAAKEAEAAEICGTAIAKNNIERVVYMGGLGDDKDNLSKHLRSRHHTGEILRKHVKSLIELRASMIIGKGSIGFEIIKRLVHRLPLQTVPTWAITKTQPIALIDALKYIQASIELKITGHEIIEIGGPEQMSYRDLIKSYGNFCGKKLILIYVPIVPLWLGAWWLNLFTPPRHAKVGRQMAESLANPMLVTNDKAKKYFPEIKPINVTKAFERED
jgi:uncharacterized protein YbjT (DUF2867 family)